MGKYLQIKEIGKVITGKTPSTEDASNFDGKYPFITPSDIKSFDEKYLLETERTLSEKGIKKLKNNILPKEAICFVCIGSTIGKMCLTNTIAYSNQQINSLIVNNNFDAHYMFYFLRYIKSYFQQLGAGTGSGKGIVNKTTFENSKVKVETNKNIQVKIADILSTYDNLIENNNKRIRLLEQMEENLYKEWFVRFRFPGYENTKFVDGIPADWKILRMSDFCYVTDGTHDTPKPVNDGGVPLVTGKCIKNGFIDFNEPYNISYQDHESISKRSGLQTGDILFSNIGTVGTTCLVNYDREFSVKNVIIFKPGNIKVSNYLYSWLNSDSIQAIFATQTNGASQQFVGLNFMRRFKILVPNENVLDLYSGRIKPIRTEIVKLHDINENLTKQRDMLLPRLMSGKLEV